MEQIITNQVEANKVAVEQPKKTLYNRKDRRSVMSMAGMFKKSSFNFTEWREQVKENIRKGFDLQDKRENSINDSIEEYITNKKDSIISAWEELGYSKAKIKLAENDWVDRVINRKYWRKNKSGND